MGENKDYMTHPEDLGCIHISEDVLATIAGGAAMEVEGIGGMMSLATKKSNARGVRLSLIHISCAEPCGSRRCPPGTWRLSWAWGGKR